MRKYGIAALVFALVFAVSVPAVPAYAKTYRSSKSQQSSKARKSSRIRNKNKNRNRNAEVRMQEEDRMRTAAAQVQKAFDEKDLDGLASLCSYPLTFIDQYGSSSQIKSQKELKKIGSQEIFTKAMQELVGSVNTAKIPVEKDGTLKAGEKDGFVLKKGRDGWKVTKIQVKGTENNMGDLVNAAEAYQKTFYYRDLETLSKQCTYPVKVYLTGGDIRDIRSAEALMALGENKVFTDELVKQVNEVNAEDLKEIDQKVEVGGTSGFWMVKTDGEWKIDLIYQ